MLSRTKRKRTCAYAHACTRTRAWEETIIGVEEGVWGFFYKCITPNNFPAKNINNNFPAKNINNNFPAKNTPFLGISITYEKVGNTTKYNGCHFQNICV